MIFSGVKVEFISDIVVPDKNRRPFFDGREEHLNYYKFKCNICENPIKVVVWDFLEESTGWAENFDKEELDKIQHHFNFKKELFGKHVFYKSHFKGSSFVGIKKCGACHQRYLLYIDFYEKQPDRYIATIQGLVQIK